METKLYVSYKSLRRKLQLNTQGKLYIVAGNLDAATKLKQKLEKGCFKDPRIIPNTDNELEANIKNVFVCDEANWRQVAGTDQERWLPLAVVQALLEKPNVEIPWNRCYVHKIFASCPKILTLGIGEDLMKNIKQCNGQPTSEVDDGPFQLAVISPDQFRFGSLTELKTFLTERAMGMEVVSKEWADNLTIKMVSLPDESQSFAGSPFVDIETTETASSSSRQALLGLSFFVGGSGTETEKLIRERGGKCEAEPSHCATITLAHSNLSPSELLKIRQCTPFILDETWLDATFEGKGILDWEEYYKDKINLPKPESVASLEHYVCNVSGMGDSPKRFAENLIRSLNGKIGESTGEPFENDLEIVPVVYEEGKDNRRTIICLQLMNQTRRPHICDRTHFPLTPAEDLMKVFRGGRFKLAVKSYLDQAFMAGLVVGCGGDIIVGEGGATVLEEEGYSIVWDKNCLHKQIRNEYAKNIKIFDAELIKNCGNGAGMSEEKLVVPNVEDILARHQNTKKTQGKATSSSSTKSCGQRDTISNPHTGSGEISVESPGTSKGPKTKRLRNSNDKSMVTEVGCSSTVEMENSANEIFWLEYIIPQLFEKSFTAKRLVMKSQGQIVSFLLGREILSYPKPAIFCIFPTHCTQQDTEPIITAILPTAPASIAFPNIDYYNECKDAIRDLLVSFGLRPIFAFRHDSNHLGVYISQHSKMIEVASLCSYVNRHGICNIYRSMIEIIWNLPRKPHQVLSPKGVITCTYPKLRGSCVCNKPELQSLTASSIAICHEHEDAQKKRTAVQIVFMENGKTLYSGPDWKKTVDGWEFDVALFQEGLMKYTETLRAAAEPINAACTYHGLGIQHNLKAALLKEQNCECSWEECENTAEHILLTI